MFRPFSLAALLVRAALIPFLVLSLMPERAAAQAQARPLTADPARAVRTIAYRQAAAVAQRRTTALTLPFFDDFANDRFGPMPDPALWDSTGGAHRNDTYATAPPSRGVVTFDGLNRFGRAYGGQQTGATDTLTSQVIDLSGQTTAELSFWWQEGGASPDILSPSTTGRFTLEFDDSSGFWDPSGWERSGTNLPAPAAFQRAVVTVPAAYCTAGFRFRFRSRGPRFGSTGVWNLDYLRLETTPAAPVRDVAFSQGLESPLRRYTAMPVWQFNAAANPADELADSVVTIIRNLDPDPLANPTPLADNGTLTVRELAGGTALNQQQFLNETRVVPAASQQRIAAPYRITLPLGAVPLTPAYKTLTNSLVLVSGELPQNTRYNDTLRRSATLANYYAYDDGSAEVVFGSNNNSDPVAVAIPFSTTVADQVAGVEIYLGGDLLTGTRLFADVWTDDPAQPGRPAATAAAHVSFVVPSDSILRRTGRWWPIYFTPVSVNGRFYVGYSQPANLVIPANIGFDVSDSLLTRAGYFLRRIPSEAWRNKYVRGAWMIRAIMNQNGLLGLSTAPTAAMVGTVYPNPVSATLDAELHLPTASTTVTSVLYDALGRAVRQAPVGAATLDVRGLAPGVYLLRVSEKRAGGADAAPRTIRVLVRQ